MGAIKILHSSMLTCRWLLILSMLTCITNVCSSMLKTPLMIHPDHVHKFNLVATVCLDPWQNLTQFALQLASSPLIRVDGLLHVGLDVLEVFDEANRLVDGACTQMRDDLHRSACQA